MPPSYINKSDTNRKAEKATFVQMLEALKFQADIEFGVALGKSAKGQKSTCESEILGQERTGVRRAKSIAHRAVVMAR
jgi:uncharacterized protein YdaT